MASKVTTAAFDPGEELNAFSALANGAGAVVTFTGLVRSLPDDPVSAMELECYPELAIAQFDQMIAEATQRFALLDATIIHRFGMLVPGDAIVQVMTLAAHRSTAFEGAQFLMDYLKTDAPFWKKETTPAGSRWVEAKPEDDRARTRWE